MKKIKKNRKRTKRQSSVDKYKIYGSIVAFLLCIGVLLFFFLSQKSEETYAIDGSAVDYKTTIEKPADLGTNMITFPAYGEMSLHQGTDQLPISLVNPEFNKALIQFIVILDDREVPLLTTGLVESGKAVLGVPLPENLKAGKHEIHLEMLGYTKSKTPTRLSGTKTSFTLMIVEKE